MRQERGLTLVELMLALGLLALMTLATLVIYRSGLSARMKNDAQTATYRACLLALEHLRSELRGAELLSPAALNGTPSTQMVYRYPEVDDNLGILVVDDQGSPIWAGTATVSLRADGKMIKTDSALPGNERVLADLGRGSITFQRLDTRLLRVVMTAIQEDRDVRKSSEHRLSVDLELPNN